jgi:alanine racemase
MTADGPPTTTALPTPVPTTQLRVDLAAFDRNLALVRDRVAPAAVMIVIKNDAYGHGSAALVRRAIDGGVGWIGALDIETALHARQVADGGSNDSDRTHLTTPIFAWLLTPSDDLAGAITGDIDLGIGSFEVLDAVAAVAERTGGVARIHLKIDTGLNRNGVRAEDWPRLVEQALEHERRGLVRVVGVFSHISEASDADDDDARARFDAALAVVSASGIHLEVRHLAASAAGFSRPEFDYDLVRIGAFLYGIPPAGGPSAHELGIEPIGSLRTQVAEVTGDRAIIPLGAWHGLPSIAAGSVSVAIGGRLHPVTRIERDWAQLDIGSTPVTAGDEAVVFGSGANGELTSTQWAEAVDTIGEEIAVRIDRRIPRVYADD